MSCATARMSCTGSLTAKAKLIIFDTVGAKVHISSYAGMLQMPGGKQQTPDGLIPIEPKPCGAGPLVQKTQRDGVPKLFA
jgi:hypothetical protein